MIILCEPERTLRAQLERCLTDDTGVVHVRKTPELQQTLAERNGQTEVVVLGPGLTDSEALEAAVRIRERDPALPVVLVSRDASSDLLRSAMRAGVRDVLTDPCEDTELKGALVRALELVHRDRPAEGPGERGKVLMVFSTKGGSGKTVVAANLAVLLAQDTREDVSVVDLDLQSGDLALMLQLLPGYTIHDAAEQVDNLDAEAMRGYLTKHRSGIELLAAPAEPIQADQIGPAAVQHILGTMRNMFGYVVIDAPPAFTDVVLAGLDESDEVVLVASMDVPSIKNLKMALQTLEQLGITRSRVHVVLNRSDSKVGLRLQEVEKAIGTSVDVAVPSSREVPLSVNQGVPLALADRRSPVASALAELATKVAKAQAPKDEKKRGGRGLFSRN